MSAGIGHWEYHSSHRDWLNAELAAAALRRFVPNYRTRIQRGRRCWYVEWRRVVHG